MSDLFYAHWFKISEIQYIWYAALWNLQTTQRKKYPISECIKRFRFEKRRVISGTRFLYHIKPQAVDDRDVYRLKAQKGMGP